MTKEQGPCVNYMTRWYFNGDSQRCEQFIYGGCQGNRNKFLTELECTTECGGGDPVVVATDLPSPSTPPTPSPVQPTAGEDFVCATLYKPYLFPFLFITQFAWDPFHIISVQIEFLITRTKIGKSLTEWLRNPIIYQNDYVHDIMFCIWFARSFFPAVFLKF